MLPPTLFPALRHAGMGEMSVTGGALPLLQQSALVPSCSMSSRRNRNHLQEVPAPFLASSLAARPFPRKVPPHPSFLGSCGWTPVRKTGQAPASSHPISLPIPHSARTTLPKRFPLGSKATQSTSSSEEPGLLAHPGAFYGGSASFLEGFSDQHTRRGRSSPIPNGFCRPEDSL